MVKCLKHLHKKYNTIIIINSPSILSIYIYIVSDEPATNCDRSMCTNAIHRCLLQPTDGLPIATTTASRVTSSNVWRLKEQESVGNVALEAVTMIYFLASYCATCFFLGIDQSWKNIETFQFCEIRSKCYQSLNPWLECTDLSYDPSMRLAECCISHLTVVVQQL